MRYIGSKVNLLEEIDSLLSKHITGKEQSFVDLFAGTNVVGQYFKPRYQIISNDLLEFSHAIAKGTIELNVAPDFTGLQEIGISDPFQYLQSYDLKDYEGDFVTFNYSPAGPEGRMYFTVENAKRIDFARNTIDNWIQCEMISEGEFYYLLDSILQAIPFVSNIAGVYAAYLKHWDKRAYKPLELIPSEIIDNDCNNKAYRQDAVQLVKELEGDILYIDTPYNSRQYSTNYHVLETIARNDSPDIHGITGQRNEDNARSDFAMKRAATKAMKDLVSDLNFSHVIVSYSTDGIIPFEDILNIFKEVAVNNEVEVKKIPFRKYKSKIVKPEDELFELLFYFQPKRATLISTKGTDNAVLNKTTSLKKISRSNGYIKSPLNYIGGKYKLLPQLIPLFPKEIDTFVDLFSGGGNVGINVDAQHVYFNDMNTKINELFRFFQGKNPEILISQIKNRIDEYQLSKTNTAGFLKFRDDYNQNQNPLDLYVLVSFSFNYQFRFNNNLKYNNPFGKDRSHFSDRMASNLNRFVNRLNQIDAIFTDHYFNEFNIENLTQNSFVYADPPYLITSGSYNDGNRGFVNWTEKQEQELYDFLDELHERGIKFALSNVLEHKGLSNNMLKAWSKKYHVNHLDYDYSNASHNTSRTGSDEVLITNY